MPIYALSLDKYTFFFNRSAIHHPEMGWNGPCSTAKSEFAIDGAITLSIGAIGRSWHFGSDSLCTSQTMTRWTQQIDWYGSVGAFSKAPLYAIPAKENPPREHSTYLVYQLVPIRFGRQNEGHETSADWECKAHPPQSCLTQWIDQRWQIGGRFISHFD